MELLESTLRELEAREKSQQNLDTFYVKDWFPTFQQEFKNADIQDLENYSNYSLQNILDDLRHIQTLYDGSPTPKFKVKQEFLVQLSQGILRQLQKKALMKEAEKVTTKPKDKPLKPYKEAKVKAPKPEKAVVETSPEKNVEKAGDGTEIQTPIIRKNKVVKVAPRRPTTPTKAAEKAAVATGQPKQEQASPDSKKEKEVDSFLTGQAGEIKLIKDSGTNQTEVKDTKEEDEEKNDSDVKGKKEIRIKKGDKDHRPGSTGKKRPKDNQWKPAMVSDGDILLSQIKEAVMNEESENEDGERRSGEGKAKKKWELTEEQEKQIREMSAQYGVEVEALKNYLETKATNNQFQWIGIKRLDNKVVDVNLELSKLESEYERFVQRRQHIQSLQLMLPNDLSSRTLPHLSRHHTTTNAGMKSRTIASSNKFHNSLVGPETTKGHHNNRSFGNSISWGTEQRSLDGGLNSNNNLEIEERRLIGSGNMRRRQATAKSLALSRGSFQQELARAAEGKPLGQDPHWSDDLSLVKSTGQLKLPTINSMSPSRRGIPSQTTVNAVSVELDEENNLRRVDTSGHQSTVNLYNLIASPNLKASLKPKRTSSMRNARGFPVLADHLVLNRMDSQVSLEDSLAAEIDNKDGSGSRVPSRQGERSRERKISASIMKKALSQISTTRSNHVISLNNVVKQNCMDSVVMDDFITIKSTVSQTREETELKGRDDYDGLALSRKDNQEEGKREILDPQAAEDEAMGTTLQTLSTKSMSTVYTVETQSRYMSLKSVVGSGMRVVEGDLEYYGEVTKLHLLGGGSQAKVFLCKVKEFEDLVALKQYDMVKSQHYGGQSYESLKNEFHMLRQLDHPSVIKYYCLYRSRKKTYTNGMEFGVIMEYMPGGSMESYIESNFDSISFRNKKALIRQILQGLDYLHKNHIIHRDLKPENLLLSDDKSQVKISDFGISTQANNDINAPRSMVGTPWYMAPEIINEEPYSSKADIWSAGCCFIHLLTGKKPYHMANAVQAMLLMTNYKSPLETCEEENLRSFEAHKGLKEFLSNCFSRDKNKRPSASQLLASSFFSADD